MENKSVFEKLSSVNVNDKVEKKNNLAYLSWSFAWSEFQKICPEATYKIKKFNGLPYVYDEKTGYMVFTSVKVEGTEREMWLPVMDGANKAMMATSYKYSTKYGDKVCEAATMFDINKTIMRCLTKNLAMFGLGLYIYSGEDLPDTEEIAPVVKETPAVSSFKRGLEKSAETLDKEKIVGLIKSLDPSVKTADQYSKYVKEKTGDELKAENYKTIIDKLEILVAESI